MLREWLSDGALGISRWCRARAQKWLNRSNWWADFEEWASGERDWKDIGRHDELDKRTN